MLVYLKLITYYYFMRLFSQDKCSRFFMSSNCHYMKSISLDMFFLIKEIISIDNQSTFFLLNCYLRALAGVLTKTKSSIRCRNVLQICSVMGHFWNLDYLQIRPKTLPCLASSLINVLICKAYLVVILV